MRAFVTGATGFIGGRLVEHLARAGHEVTALVRSEASGLPDSVTTVRGQLEDDVNSLSRAMREHDVLFHLAARISFDPRRLPELLRVNAEGTERVLAAARRGSVSRTVVVSSACTIGLAGRADSVLDEDTPFDQRLADRNPYLQSKHLCEQHALDAARSGQWVCIVNPSTVFGAGDRSLNSGTLIHKTATSRFMPVPPGGSNVVDVDDVATGIAVAAERGRSGVRYILGGANLRFSQIVDRIAAVVGRRPRLIRLGSAMRLPMSAAAWMIQRLTRSDLITPQIIADTFAFKFYSSDRARSELGWEARRDFGTSVSAAWDYYRRHGLIR